MVDVRPDRERALGGKRLDGDNPHCDTVLPAQSLYLHQLENTQSIFPVATAEDVAPGIVGAWCVVLYDGLGWSSRRRSSMICSGHVMAPAAPPLWTRTQRQIL
jgi:hypothetical protein